MKYKPFVLENLQQVRFLDFEQRGGTFWMSTIEGGGGSPAEHVINMGDGHQDDKIGGFTLYTCQFVVRMLEQVTGFRFRQKRTSFGYLWERTEQTVR